MAKIQLIRRRLAIRSRPPERLHPREISQDMLDWSCSMCTHATYLCASVQRHMEKKSFRATDVFLGDPARFADSKALASYVGIIPTEYSSGGRQKLGGLSKQGNPLLRFLWCEAGMHAAHREPELQRFYRRKLIQKGLGVGPAT